MAAVTAQQQPHQQMPSSMMSGMPSLGFVKQEIVDPSYLASSSPHPSANDQPMEKVKRKYTKKAKGDGIEPSAPKRIKAESIEEGDQGKITDHMPVQKRKRDRFKGTTEAEVLTRVLPDHVKPDLDILIVGINPGLTAAYVQHHYAGPGNHFWKCLYLSGLIPEPMNAKQDHELLNFGIGFTNIVARTTRGSADLSRKEIAEGGEILKEKMLKIKPKIALFNGKGIYEVFSGSKKFDFGLQPDMFPGVPDCCIFVNPSSSARCTQLPRAVDKVPFYEALKRVRDYIRENGSIEGIDRSTVTFPDFKLVTAPSKKVKEEIKAEPVDPNDPVAVATAEETARIAAETPTKVKPAPRKKKNLDEKTKRGRPKKKPYEPSPPVGDSSNSAPTSALPPDQYAATLPNQSNIPSTQNGNHTNNSVPTGHAQNMNMSYHVPSTMQQATSHMTGFTAMSQHAPLNSAASTMQQGMGMANSGIQSMAGMHHPHNFTIKKEAMEHNDRDLTAALLEQSFQAQQNMIRHQQAMAANGMMQQSMGAGRIKQERQDWPGYDMGANPAVTMGYNPYTYWNYLHCAANPVDFMSGQYHNSTIPTSQMVTEPTALHVASNHLMNPTPALSQPQVSSNGAAVTYSSPQEASSPAMSGHSNLTQASLDSLPKADSASTVANWLQNIPTMSQ